MVILNLSYTQEKMFNYTTCNTFDRETVQRQVQVRYVHILFCSSKCGSNSVLY